MSTPENRARYDRSRLRYPSDLTDQEWALIEPLIPPAKRGGNRQSQSHSRRLPAPTGNHAGDNWSGGWLGRIATLSSGGVCCLSIPPESRHSTVAKSFGRR
jgi:hypothetical protein